LRRNTTALALDLLAATEILEIAALEEWLLDFARKVIVAAVTDNTGGQHRFRISQRLWNDVLGTA